MCFSDRQPGSFGPRRITQKEIRAAFTEGWEILEIIATTFLTNLPDPEAQAWRATIARAD